MHFLKFYVSHGSATRFFRGCEKYYIYFVDSLLLYPTVIEFSKLVNSWWSYCKNETACFFSRHSVYYKTTEFYSVTYFYSEIQDSLCTQAADMNSACRRAYQSPKTDVQKLGIARKWQQWQCNVGMHPHAPSTDWAGHIQVPPLHSNGQCNGNGSNHSNGNGQTPQPTLPWSCRRNVR